MFPFLNSINALVVLSILFLHAFLGLAVLVTNQSVSADLLTRQLVNEIESPIFTLFFTWITKLGSTNFILSLVIVIIVFLLMKRKWLDTCIFFVLMSSSTLLTVLFKNLIQRVRPFHDSMLDAVSYSFPSAHTVGSIACYGFLIYLCLKSQRRSKVTKIGVCMLLGIIILLVSLSRIYLDVHYLTDIVAGYLLGPFCFSISILLTKKHLYTSSIVKR